MTFTNNDDSSSKVPLKNYFINTSTSQPVNGGGSSVGMATRAFRLLESDGGTYNLYDCMPATSDGESLVFTFTKADGTTTTKNVTMAA